MMRDEDERSKTGAKTNSREFSARWARVEPVLKDSEPARSSTRRDLGSPGYADRKRTEERGISRQPQL